MSVNYDCRNKKKRFNSRRKVDSEFAATTSVGSLFQMSVAATAKVRLPNVDSFTCGTTRRLVLAEPWTSRYSIYTLDVHGERNGRRPGKSSKRISGPRHGLLNDAIVIKESMTKVTW